MAKANGVAAWTCVKSTNATGAAFFSVPLPRNHPPPPAAAARFARRRITTTHGPCTGTDVEASLDEQYMGAIGAPVGTSQYVIEPHPGGLQPT